MSEGDGVLSVVQSGKETEFEWKITNFSLDISDYVSPKFEFEGESWWLALYPTYTDGYMRLRLRRLLGLIRGSPIEVEFSVSVKIREGRKSFERRGRKCFEGYAFYVLKDCEDRSFYDIEQWIRTSEFNIRRTEFLSSGCFTILLTMKKADSRESKDATAAAACSCCNKNIDEDKISFHKDCLNKEAKCPSCDEVVNLQKWFDHVCQMANVPATKCSYFKEILRIYLEKKFSDKFVECSGCDEMLSLNNLFDHECQMGNAKDASAPDVCFCCKERRHGESLHKIPVHEQCLDQPIMCSNCVEIVSLQKWFGHECQAANVKSESSASQTSGSQIKNKIAQDLKKLIFNHENCDVLLRVQGQEFSAHQAILAAGSPVFASLFRSNMKETVTGTVDIEDVDPNCFSDFLCFLYCGEIENFSFENIRSLFHAADKYGVTDLRTMCLEFMREKLSDEIFLRKAYLDSFQR